MPDAKLLVERGSSYKDPSQDWGEFRYTSMPSPGDRLAVLRDGETHYLTVLCVHHAPVALADGSIATDEPKASVVAKWTGSAE